MFVVLSLGTWSFSLVSCKKKPADLPQTKQMQSEPAEKPKSEPAPTSTKAEPAPITASPETPEPKANELISGAPEATVTRQSSVSWSFRPIKFQGNVEVYDTNADATHDVGETKLLKLDQPLPFKKRLKMPFRIKVPNLIVLALVVKNTTPEPMYFYANLHKFAPEISGLGAAPACICINKIFEVPPSTTWYRIVNLRLRNATKGSVEINHELVGMTFDEIKLKKLQSHIYHADF
jgi:hypothetical protein